MLMQHIQAECRADHIVGRDCFAEIEQLSVGVLLRFATQCCHSLSLQVTVCGSQCSDLGSVSFLNALPAVNAICCAPEHIPAAKIAAARAQITATPSPDSLLGKLHSMHPEQYLQRVGHAAQEMLPFWLEDMHQERDWPLPLFSSALH